MFKFGSKNFGKRRREGEGEGEEEHLFIQDNCVSFRKKLLSMQILLLKTQKNKKTDNNVIFQSKIYISL